ncbi:MAG: acetolactate decarboxylase [Flavobacteriales bacterium]|nr:acetolactate decarboxylase [Flavobacteriales bacterium]
MSTFALMLRLPMFSALLFSTIACSAQNGPVIATGAMRNTMFNGQLAGLIQLDSIAKPGTYGIGPMEYLRGEVLLLDGVVFVSEVEKELGMQVVQRTEVRAPFFVHQRVTEWTTVQIPDSVVDLPTLDGFLTARFAQSGEPFAFRIGGVIPSVDVHIVDVPMGSEVNGPDDAHQHNKDYHLEDRTMDLVGFFSTKHKAVFTHHDTNIHVHAITAEGDWMGHVEQVRFSPSSVQLQIATIR